MQILQGGYNHLNCSFPHSLTLGETDSVVFRLVIEQGLVVNAIWEKLKLDLF